MNGMVINLIRRSYLHQSAQIHDRDPVTYVSDYQQIVGYEQISESQSLFQFIELIYHLCLNGYIQS